MFMGFVVLVLLLAVPLLGGSLRRVSGLRLRLGWLVFPTLAVQLYVICLMPNGNHTFQATTHVLTYVVALVLVWVNRSVPGLMLIGLGTFMNGFTIAINKGTLPSSARAEAVAGLRKHGEGLANSAPLDHPHLPWLGDVLVTPSWLPFRNVASIGDVVILAGAAVLVWCVSGAHLPRARTRANA